jgi:hypothetical protein
MCHAAGVDTSINKPKIQTRFMRRGKLRDMVTEVKTAPGRWAKVLPRLRTLALHLSLLAMAAGLGYLQGVRRSGAGEEEGVAGVEVPVPVVG